MDTRAGRKLQRLLMVKGTESALLFLLLCCSGTDMAAASSNRGKSQSSPWTVVKDVGDWNILGPWAFLGPFSIGKTEIDGDPVEAHGGIRNLTRQKNKVFFSELVQGGKAGWTKLKTQNGVVALSFPLGERANVDFNKVIQSISKMSGLEFQGWLVSDFIVEHGGHFSLLCTGAHHVEVDNHRLLHGDVYSTGWARSTLALEQGKHTIFIRVRSKASATIACSVRRVSEREVSIHRPSSSVPDIVGGRLTSGLLSLPVANLGSSWKKIRVRVSRSEVPRQALSSWARGKKFLPVVTQEAPGEEGVWVAPGQTLMMQASFKLGGAPGSGDLDPSWADSAPGDGSCLDAWLRAEADELQDDGNMVTTAVSEDLKVGFRCRVPSQSFIFTFLDHDGSVAQAAAVRPWNAEECEAKGGCGVLLSLSGVGVQANDQADSHKYKKGGSDFVFGFQDAWILAPERDGAHNWEGTGYNCAVKSLAALQHLVSQLESMQGFSVDTRRVLFAGHSRGGHGAWMMGMHHPDRAVGVVSLSGWWKREEYADANILFDLDHQLSSLQPQLKMIFEACIADHDSSHLAGNLLGLPVMIRTGSEDMSVPPWHSRRMARILQEKGVKVTFNELPGKAHWWWDTEKESDGGAMNDAQLRKFYSKLSQPLPAFGKRMEAVVYNPSTHSGRGGIRILQQVVPYRRSLVDIQVEEEEEGRTWLLVGTVNVLRLTLCREFGRWTRNASAVRLVLDGQEIEQQVLSRMMEEEGKGKGAREEEEETGFCSMSTSLLRENNEWKVVETDGWIRSQRSVVNYGPMRQTFASPFLIVVGTQTQDQNISQRLLEIGIFLSTGHAMASRSFSPIVNDSMLSDAMAEKHNLILVGGVRYNSWAARAASAWSERDKERGGGGGGGNFPEVNNQTSWSVRVGRCSFSSPNNGAIFTFPRAVQNSRAPRLDAHITGGSIDAMEAAVRYSFASNVPLTRAPLSNMFPDYFVTSESFRWKGYGGVLAAGFWSNRWEFMAEAGFVDC